jgi:hypothetical protein
MYDIEFKILVVNFVDKFGSLKMIKLKNILYIINKIFSEINSKSVL